MITKNDFTKWYEGLKFVFDLKLKKCKVYFYDHHLFTTQEKETIIQLRDDPEHFMRVYFNDTQLV